MVKFFIETSSSFNILEYDSFKELLKRKIEPISRHTLSNKIVGIAKKKQEDLVDMFNAVDFISLVADAWKSPFGRNVFGICASYLADFDVIEVPIFVEVINGHTNGDYIQKKLDLVCGHEVKADYHGLNIEKKVQAITLDGGSDMIRGARLAGIPRIYCFNHLLSLATSDFLHSETISPLFEHCRKIMNWYQRSNAKLPTVNDEDEWLEYPYDGHRPRKIAKYVETRWLTAAEMLDSITYNMNALDALLREKKKTELLIPVEWLDLLQHVTQFIHDLYEIQLFMESPKTSSFAHLLPLFLRLEVFLREEVQRNENDDYVGGLQIFKSAFEKRFVREYHDERTYMALMLHPLHKDLLYTRHYLALGYEQEWVDNLKNEMREAFREKYETWLHENNIQCDRRKRRRTNVFFDDIRSNHSDSAEQELSRFLEYQVERESFTNAFDWWKIHQEQYPNLSRFAKKYLVLCGSSSFVERLWSRGRDICDHKRSSLADRTLASLIFLKGHF